MGPKKDCSANDLSTPTILFHQTALFPVPKEAALYNIEFFGIFLYLFNL